MQSFLSRYESQVKGVLSGFDRIRFRGTLRWLANLHGMYGWLSRAGVLLKDFGEYATSLTDQIKESTQQLAESKGRPLEYLASPSIRKEDYARDIAKRVSEEMTFPGEIKVTVLREMRTVEYAK